MGSPTSLSDVGLHEGWLSDDERLLPAAHMHRHLGALVHRPVKQGEGDPLPAGRRARAGGDAFHRVLSAGEVTAMTGGDGTSWPSGERRKKVCIASSANSTWWPRLPPTLAARGLVRRSPESTDGRKRVTVTDAGARDRNQFAPASTKGSRSAAARPRTANDDGCSPVPLGIRLGIQQRHRRHPLPDRSARRGGCGRAGAGRRRALHGGRRKPGAGLAYHPQAGGARGGERGPGRGAAGTVTAG